MNLEHPFTDSISDMKFLQQDPNTAFLAVSSWDGKIVVFQLSTADASSLTPQMNPQCLQQTQLSGPIMSICWEEQLAAGGFAGGAMFGGQQ